MRKQLLIASMPNGSLVILLSNCCTVVPSVSSVGATAQLRVESTFIVRRLSSSPRPMRRSAVTKFWPARPSEHVPQVAVGPGPGGEHS